MRRQWVYFDVGLESHSMNASQPGDLIDSATKTRLTGFGDRYGAPGQASRSVVLTQRAFGDRLEGHRTTPRDVTWTINGDGTATCDEGRSMWIQAPWGLTWEGGSEFSGAPCLVSWLEASQLFGRGVRVELSKDGTIGLSMDQIRLSGTESGYTRGACRVHFAGSSDWRLPTVAEWYTVMGLDSSKMADVLRVGEDQKHWTANERHEWMHGVPFLRSRHNCAWSANAGRWFLDSQVEERFPVMFVRSL
jgi:hypothetical protein